MVGNFSADINCSERRTVLRERSSWKTVSSEDQIMSKVKYQDIFESQMETIVFSILVILYKYWFLNTRNLKIGKHCLDIYASYLQVLLSNTRRV